MNLRRVLEIEETTKHDVIAFLTNVAEYVGPASRHIHYGMTSSDVLDTALAYQMKSAGELLLKELKQSERCFEEKSNRTQKNNLCGTKSWHSCRSLFDGFESLHCGSKKQNEISNVLRMQLIQSVPEKSPVR